jgi:signal transduction histidine kinase
MKKRSSACVPAYITTLFIICLLSLAGMAAFTYGNMQKLIKYNEWMDHTWSVKDHLKDINLLVMDGENSLNAYFLSGNPASLAPWKITRDKLDTEFNVLTALVRNNPVQQKNLMQLRALFDRRMKKFDENLKLFEDGGLTQVARVAKVSEDWETMDEVRLLDVIMEKEELQMLTTTRTQLYDEYHRAQEMGNMVSGLIMLVLVLFYRLIQANFTRQRAAEDALKLTNDNLETIVLARTEQLSVLSHHLLKVSEKEKAELARELHDEMGSNLTAIRMDLSLVMEKLKKTEPTLAEHLLRAKLALQETVDLKRRIIEDLRPSMLDNLGLAASIRNHYEEITRIAGLSHEVDIAEDFDEIDPAWAIALFRIAQESLNNVVKYAQAKHVKITVKREKTGIWLQILDDGIGIPADALKKPKSHGLLGMRERALLLGGHFSVVPGPYNRGTAIETFLPFAYVNTIKETDCPPG